MITSITARRLLESTGLVLALAASAPVWGQVRSFNIPPQPAVDAIPAFARQAGIQIITASARLRGLTVQAVQGEQDVRGALRRMITPLGLEIASDAGSTIVLRPVAHQPAPAARPDTPRPTPAHPAAEPAERAADTDPPSRNANEIVVTAQKVSERLIDVPAAISSFSAKDLNDQKIEGGSELLRGIPNVSFSKDNFTGYNFTIRGVGTKAISVTADPAVAVNFNSSTLIRNRLFEQEYFDVTRVEVLRGPQGTLYGRNATAGVVNMIPHAPELGRWTTTLQGETGNYASKRVSGHINIPSGDNFALRLAGAWTKRNGYDFNTVTQRRVNGRDLYSTRLSARWEPDARLRFSAYWEHFDENDDRARTGKQLCTRGETPRTIDYIDENGAAATSPVAGPGGMASLTPGCQEKTLYSDASYGVPNGLGFPIVIPLILALPGSGEGGPFGDYWTDFSLDPFATANGQQSRNLREIATVYDPRYRARNDLFQINAEVDLTDRLHLTSQTLFTKDYYNASQDYFRYQASPYFTPPEAYRPKEGDPPDAETVHEGWRPWLGSRDGLGTFKDPQLGELTRPVAVDRSEARSQQWSQEVRLHSSFGGPINFHVGANFLSYKTTEEYYVFSNPFTAAAVTSASFCDKKGVGCPYIDPLPLDKISGEGHNYYRGIQPLTTTSWAGFGELYWKPITNLKITAGLRYSNDHKRITPYANQLLASTNPFMSSPSTVDRGHPADPDEIMRWGRVTGRLALDWKPRLGFTDETAIYASYARGYKAGGDNPRGREGTCGPDGYPIPPALECAAYTKLPTNFRPEDVNSFEIGMKNSLAQGRATLNVSAFFNDYKNYQISQLINRAINTENVHAITYGAEVEAAWTPSRHFRIGATLGYLGTRIGKGQRSFDILNRTQGHDDWIAVNPWASAPNPCIAPKTLIGKYLKDHNPVVAGYEASDGGLEFMCESAHISVNPNHPRPNHNVFNKDEYGFTYNPLGPYDPSKPADYFADNPNNYGAPNNGYGFPVDLSGHQLPNAPHLTFNIGAEYNFDLGKWQLSLRGDYYRQSSSYARIYNTAYDHLRAWDNANVAVTLTRSDSRMTYQVYVKNLFDGTPITDAYTGPQEVGTFTNIFTLDPRIIGFSARIAFR
ncbi:TonB-dependent receptor domain-containing protein [Sphingomonas morindae]|uniref:TonB-dependent receptor n=1 Tax=Sphingomonas morindae TaxID=1541170 RepID=A0ABY4XCG7_9SPHN|nr:TonB-dependent receptor [Sphingomonas morindae]USI74668.1 TonB-dependent receptor [Sphingomonas morindae]